MLPTERDFMAQIIQAAILLGWRIYHTHDSRRSPAGFPDLFMVRGSRVLAFEVKTQRGKLTQPQQDWLTDMQIAGIDVKIARPSDWEWIQKVLA